MMIGHIQPKTFHVGFRRHLILCKRKMVRMPDWCCQGSHNFSLGTVYLQEKPRSSQRPSASSLVSIRLENEGRLLLEDRNPPPSHFHPFDIAHSKPNRDDDCKLDEYCDFGGPSHSDISLSKPTVDDWDSDTDSSVPSCCENRSLTPADSPALKRSRSDQNNWKFDSPSSRSATGNSDKPSTDADIDQSEVQLPSIFTTFEDSYKGYSQRGSLPITHSESGVRHAPYPPTSLRQTYSLSNQSTLSSYTFASNNEDAVEKHSGRPRLSTILNFGITNSYKSTFPHSILSNSTTPSSTTLSPSTSDYPPDYHLPTALSPYSEIGSWNPSTPLGIVRSSSTPGQLSSPPIKYGDSLRLFPFSTPTSQAQMYGSARISGQHDFWSKDNSWSFPNPDFVLSSSNPPFMTPPAPAFVLSNSQPKPPQLVTCSSLVDRPQRKRGKLSKETTDYLKAWLYRHSDHPYPSEDEKKQLCHATGLSMSQVSNWMINVSHNLRITPKSC